MLRLAHHHHRLHIHPLQEGEPKGQTLNHLPAVEHWAVHLEDTETEKHIHWHCLKLISFALSDLIRMKWVALFYSLVVTLLWLLLLRFLDLGRGSSDWWIAVSWLTFMRHSSDHCTFRLSFLNFIFKIYKFFLFQINSIQFFAVILPNKCFLSVKWKAVQNDYHTNRESYKKCNICQNTSNLIF